MARLMVRGGEPLRGSIRINGAKNAVLPMMAAAVLTRSECVIRDVPDIRDVRVMIEILKDLGVSVQLGEIDGRRRLSLKAESIRTDVVNAELMKKMRSSVLLFGPLLARLGSARMTYPGGCAIGPRPVDMHLDGFAAMGATVNERGGQVTAAAGRGRLSGAEIHLEYPSVGATENIMMAAARADGVTRIWNPAREPEVANLAAFLQALGAEIEGIGSDVITVRGSGQLGGAECGVIPDRIEAGTYAIAGVITGGELTLENVRPEHLRAFVAKMKEVGAGICVGRDRIHVRGPERPGAADVRTLPYPGYPTDLQNQYLALSCVGEGTSVVTESIFENRFKVAAELTKMGASIHTEGRLAVVKGVDRLCGASVEADDDLRGGASLVLAGLRAEGTTVVRGAEYIDRGYMNLAERLRSLGANVVAMG